jgi:hypothetical protein
VAMIAVDNSSFAVDVVLKFFDCEDDRKKLFFYLGEAHFNIR